MAVKGKDTIGRLRLSLTVCKRTKKRETETVVACVLCVSGVVRLLMLRGNHVSGSVISDSELEAGRQMQTQHSRGSRHYGAGLQTTTKSHSSDTTKSFDEVKHILSSGRSGGSIITSHSNK